MSDIDILDELTAREQEAWANWEESKKDSEGGDIQYMNEIIKTVDERVQVLKTRHKKFDDLLALRKS